LFFLHYYFIIFILLFPVVFFSTVIAYWLKEVPLLKRYAMMAPFVSAFDKIKAKQSFEPIRIPYRDEESIYIVCYEGKSLVIVFSIKFRDPDDIVLAKVFLQEFKDAKRDKALGNAPSINFTQGVKPAELKGIQSGEPDDVESLKSYGFMSLSMYFIFFIMLIFICVEWIVVY